MLLTNIKYLLGAHTETKALRGQALAQLPGIEQAYLRIEGSQVVDYGPMSILKTYESPAQTHDLSDRYVLPCWCDSHTHLVFAGSREQEFVDKIRGLTYAEIAQKGGGILNSAQLLQKIPAEVLFQQAWKRLEAIKKLGTGAIEIKSGYGLNPEAEIKMLRVIKRLKQEANIPIKATFLGAHAFPTAYKDDRRGYIRQIIEEMLPAIALEGLADYIDVFCEQGFFTPVETAQILEAGRRYGLKAKLHANQLHNSGGVQVGIQAGAVSVDHLENIGQEEIQLLAQHPTIATLLPSAAFFLRLPYPPARQLIEAGAAVALATDYNPGSSPSGNMPLLVALSCIQMRMLPEEAINAATFNGACAMEVQQEVGSIAVGKRANLIVTKAMPSLAYLPYAFGSNLIEQVLINGSVYHWEL
ncbi:MAG: imidazolonepropionase [Haliscomenobacter sp.]|uniref:imidazolonepropionase n=1 Tax=Haliscomenobacter sp. TaxID=2717303 RepID=UPI0029A3A33A|nr:imidazolonepropionase [Haliscomenobacter sp.]MDX2066982.1 imidazolonepropionase [Haliscomenobacter sp.]